MHVYRNVGTSSPTRAMLNAAATPTAPHCTPTRNAHTVAAVAAAVQGSWRLARPRASEIQPTHEVIVMTNAAGARAWKIGSDGIHARRAAAR